MKGRDDLLTAAFELLGQGEDSPQPANVAAAAGVSKALVFHHFGSRAGLEAAMAADVLAQTAEGLERLVAEEPNPRARLIALARTLLEEPVATSPLAEAAVLRFWLKPDAAGRVRAAARDDLVRAFVEATVRDGIATGALRATTPPDEVARRILMAWHGASLAYCAGADVQHERRADELAQTLDETYGPQ